MTRHKYLSDPRYAKIQEKMDLLNITDVSTSRQAMNGTIVWKLPIKNYNSGKTNIEVASFSTGYVRNQNSGYSNYQLNKRCESEPQYYKDYKWNDDYSKQTFTGKYQKFTTRGCKLIPIEIDRLEYLISYCLKNYYIKHANFVANGDYVAKWTHEYAMNGLQNKLANSVPKWKYDEAMNLGHEQDCGHYDRIKGLEENLEDAVSTIMDHEEKIEKLQNKLQSIIRTARH